MICIHNFVYIEALVYNITNDENTVNITIIPINNITEVSSSNSLQICSNYT